MVYYHHSKYSGKEDQQASLLCQNFCPKAIAQKQYVGLHNTLLCHNTNPVNDSCKSIEVLNFHSLQATRNCQSTPLDSSGCFHHKHYLTLAIFCSSPFVRPNEIRVHTWLLLMLLSRSFFQNSIY